MAGVSPVIPLMVDDFSAGYRADVDPQMVPQGGCVSTTALSTQNMTVKNAALAVRPGRLRHSVLAGGLTAISEFVDDASGLTSLIGIDTNAHILVTQDAQQTFDATAPAPLLMLMAGTSTPATVSSTTRTRIAEFTDNTGVSTAWIVDGVHPVKRFMNLGATVKSALKLTEPTSRTLSYLAAGGSGVVYAMADNGVIYSGIGSTWTPITDALGWTAVRPLAANASYLVRLSATGASFSVRDLTGTTVEVVLPTNYQAVSVTMAPTNDVYVLCEILTGGFALVRFVYSGGGPTWTYTAEVAITTGHGFIGSNASGVYALNDSGVGGIAKYSLTLAPMGTFGTEVTSVHAVIGIAVTEVTVNVLFGTSVAQFTVGGVYQTMLGAGGTAIGEFSTTLGIAVLSYATESLYVSNTDRTVSLLFETAGAATDVLDVRNDVQSPIQAPTLAVIPGGGSLPAGTYQIAYSYAQWDGTQYVESVLSPLSDPLTVATGADYGITITAMMPVVAVNTARNWYVYFYVIGPMSVQDATSGSDLPTRILERQASSTYSGQLVSASWYGTFQPPSPMVQPTIVNRPHATCTTLMAFKQRMLYADGATCYWSNLNDPSFAEDKNYIRDVTDATYGGSAVIGLDGAPITAFGQFGSYGLIYKQSGVYLIAGEPSDASMTIMQRSAVAGAVNQETVCSCEDYGVISLGPTAVWLFNGQAFLNIANSLIPKTGNGDLRQFTLAQLQNAVACYDPARHWYVLTIPTATTSVTYIYDLTTVNTGPDGHPWMPQTGWASGCMVYAQHAATTGIYSSSRAGDVFVLPATADPLTDAHVSPAAPTAIAYAWLSGQLLAGDPKHAKDINEIAVYLGNDTSPDTLTVNVFANGSTLPAMAPVTFTYPSTPIRLGPPALNVASRLQVGLSGSSAAGGTILGTHLELVSRGVADPSPAGAVGPSPPTVQNPLFAAVVGATPDSVDWSTPGCLTETYTALGVVCVTTLLPTGYTRVYSGAVTATIVGTYRATGIVEVAS